MHSSLLWTDCPLSSSGELRWLYCLSLVDSPHHFLFRMIIDDPVDACAIRISESNPLRVKWLPIKQRWWQVVEGHWPDDEVNPLELQSLLRFLSQVCRSLRPFALPLLWAFVHVDKIEQLGRLRETLRVSSDIAPLIRSFVFLWNGGRDGVKCANYLPRSDSLLDIAFRDRGACWNSLVESGCEVTQGFPQFGLTQSRYVIHEGIRHVEPGEPSIGNAGEYDHDAPNINSSGPDCMGEDLVIKNPEQLTDCLIEIFASLTSLETLGWNSFVASMPLEIFNLLTKLDTLTSLSVQMTFLRGSHQACEYLVSSDAFTEGVDVLASLLTQCRSGS